MARVVIQAGHINVQYNCNLSMRSSTGAPGEQECNLRVANRLSEILRQKGFEVKQTDANANCDTAITSADWDMFLSLHCDANYAGNEGGGFVDFPEPSTDGATVQSQKIAKAIESEYFTRTGIRNVPSRSNVNTRYYYMWRSLSLKTPCVLIEMGERQDPHDSVILADTERVATALARGVCSAFGVAYDPPTPNPCEIELGNARKTISELEKQIGNLKKDNEAYKLTIAKAKMVLDGESI